MATKEYWNALLSKFEGMDDASFELLVQQVDECMPDMPFCILTDEPDPPYECEEIDNESLCTYAGGNSLSEKGKDLYVVFDLDNQVA